MLEVKVGDRVMIDCIEGFGGPAHVIETRNFPGSRFRVHMDDNNPAVPFWAHDFEVTPLVDSRIETYKHIHVVQGLMRRVLGDLVGRLHGHDQSKLVSPKVEVFDEYTPKLAGSTYGSDEYKSYLAGMKPALDHHYAANDHHPEHFPTPPDYGVGVARLKESRDQLEFGPGTCGTQFTDAVQCMDEVIASRKSAVRSMSLIQLLEMLCDWKAATLRHNDGDIRKSIEINQRRFGYSDELKQILLNTLPAIEQGSPVGPVKSDPERPVAAARLW